MTLDRFLKKRVLVRRKPAPDEIANLPAIADHELMVASKIDFSADARFVHAYAAALAASEVLVRAAGYRTRGQGHHMTLFSVVKLLVPTEAAVFDYFDKCRRARNTAFYEKPGQATQTDADLLLDKATAFRSFAVKWVRTHHPKSLP